MIAAQRYQDFLRRHARGRVLYLELGVGDNPPGIIKYPFWQFAMENPDAIYACVNLSQAYAPRELEQRSICISGDIGDTLVYLQFSWTKADNRSIMTTYHPFCGHPKST